jgi:hypothetical protein
MNKSFAFFGRERELDELRTLYTLRKHVLIVGPAGYGKTAVLREVRPQCPLLVCEETSSLRRVCDSAERQLGWSHHKLDVIERKNRLLAYLVRPIPRRASLDSSRISLKRFQSGSPAVRTGRAKSGTSGLSFTNSRALNSCHLLESTRGCSSTRPSRRETSRPTHANTQLNCTE